MNADALMKLLRGIYAHWKLIPEAEVTLEANPEDMTLEKAKILKELGINRISLGAQSFNDAYLKFLGRAHNSRQIYNAVDCLRQAGINNINVDLMYGFPGQKTAELKSDLTAMVELATQHVSIYELTVEPNSRFYAQQISLDGTQLLEEHYRLIVDTFGKAGIHQYEVSNFARAGKESRHNTSYWLGVPYIGLGMAAHSFVDGKRWWNQSRLNVYLEQMASQGRAIEGTEDLSARTLFLERVIFGLRMNAGIDLEALSKEMKYSLDHAQKKFMEDLIEQKYLAQQGNRLATTMEGRLRLDEIAARLI